MHTYRIVALLVAIVLINTGYVPSAIASTTTGKITKATVITTKTTVPTEDQATVEARVREFFKDTPTMIEVARCESKFRQFTDSGNPLRSNGMIGVFQFYESIHAPGAKALGFDLATLTGNLGYAKHVYETEGLTPWNGSRFCWETAVHPTVAATTLTITDEAKRAKLLEQIATLTKLIALLQKQLEDQKALAVAK
jgi:hypothetical protein